jgi:hypothetical protein
MLGTMLALLFASLCIWKTTASGDDRPKPTPQMMAPDERPPLNSNGMIYAVGTTYVDRGGY